MNGKICNLLKMKTAHDKNIMIRLWLALLFITLMTACDYLPHSGEGKVSTPEIVHPSSLTPVSPQVTELYDVMIKLAAADESRNSQALTKDFIAWQEFRASHCLNLQVSSTGQEGVREACEVAMDQRKIEELKLLKFTYLLEQPPLPSVVGKTIDFEIPSKDQSRRKLSVVSPNMNFAAIGHYDGKVEIYDLVNGRCLYEGKPVDNFVWLEFTPNSRLLAVKRQSQPGLVYIDAISGEEYLRIERLNGPIRLLGDGRLVLSLDRRALVLTDIVSGKEATISLKSNSSAQQLYLDPERRLAVVVTDRGEMELWQIGNPGDATPLRWVATSSSLAQDYRPINGLFSANGESFYTISAKGNLEQWSLPSFANRSGTKIPERFFGQTPMIELRDGTLLFAVASDLWKERLIYLFHPKSRRAARIKLGQDNIVGMAENGEELLVVRAARFHATQLPELNEFIPVATLTPAVQNTRVVQSQTGELLQVEAIGVYEGTYPNGVTRGHGQDLAGTVEVEIGNTEKPLALVLTSYEAVNWVIIPSGNAKIKYVFLGGYKDSSVNSPPGATVIRIGRSYAYNRGGADYQRLQNTIREYSGKDFDLFQGTYTGKYFSVGQMNSSGGQVHPGVYRYKNENGTTVFTDKLQ